MRAALVLGAPVRQPAELRDAAREPVARSLELLQAEQAGPDVALRCGHRRGDERKPLGDDRRVLVLEPCELGPQRAPRGALADLGACALTAIESEQSKRRGPLGLDHAHPPIGARGLPPQKICVPSIPIMCTRTMLRTIDLAVALPTPTGPPLAV